MPPLAALIGDTFGLRHLGKIQAVMEASWMLGGALGPIFVGYLFDRSGGYFVSFLVLAVTASVPAVLIILLKPPKDS